MFLAINLVDAVLAMTIYQLTRWRVTPLGTYFLAARSQRRSFLVKLAKASRAYQVGQIVLVLLGVLEA